MKESKLVGKQVNLYTYDGWVFTGTLVYVSKTSATLSNVTGPVEGKVYDNLSFLGYESIKPAK